jgi:tRNA (guanine37-N1)-methyltransferase
MSNAVDFDVDSEMFRPPINRLMKVLDRPFFQKKIRLSAAQIIDAKDISKTRAELKSDLLCRARMKNIVSVPEHDCQAKALLLRPGIKNEGTIFGQEMMTTGTLVGV